MKEKKSIEAKQGVLKFVKSTGKFMVDDHALKPGDFLWLFLVVAENEMMAYETGVEMDEQERLKFTDMDELVSNFLGNLVLVVG